MSMQVSGIKKAFAGESVLHDISFALAPQATLSILGRSGCGKTTLLRILAGLLPADAGSFTVQGRELLSLPPQARGVVYLGQEPLLFPHLDVFENIAFGLRLRKLPEAEVQAAVARMLAQLGLEAHGRKRPHMLSGGQRQRVAFGRAIIIHPTVLLLDEPFGSLDAETRLEMQALFAQLRRAEGITALFVTHDLREALTVGDAMGRMVAGSLDIYPDIPSFLDHADAQVQGEIAFWKNITDLRQP